MDQVRLIVTKVCNGEWEHYCQGCESFHKYLANGCKCPDCAEYKVLPLKECPICGTKA